MSIINNQSKQKEAHRMGINEVQSETNSHYTHHLTMLLDDEVVYSFLLNIATSPHCRCPKAQH